MGVVLYPFKSIVLCQGRASVAFCEEMGKRIFILANESPPIAFYQAFLNNCCVLPCMSYLTTSLRPGNEISVNCHAKVARNARNIATADHDAAEKSPLITWATDGGK